VVAAAAAALTLTLENYALGTLLMCFSNVILSSKSPDRSKYSQKMQFEQLL
jgi:hypothetical protein